jgi:hypothetical protein
MVGSYITLYTVTGCIVYVIYCMYTYFSFYSEKVVPVHVTNWSVVDSSWSYGPLKPIDECRYPHALSFRMHTLYTSPICAYMIQFVSSSPGTNGRMFHPLEAMGRVSILEWFAIRVWGTALRTTIPLCVRCTGCVPHGGILSMQKLAHDCPWPIMTHMALVYTPLFDEGLHGFVHRYWLLSMLGIALVVLLYTMYIVYMILCIGIREMTLYILNT